MEKLNNWWNELHLFGKGSSLDNVVQFGIDTVNGELKGATFGFITILGADVMSPIKWSPEVDTIFVVVSAIGGIAINTGLVDKLLE